MEHEFDDLVRRYETGQISRRQLLASLAACCAVTPAAARAQSSPAKIEVAGWDHIALRVSDVERSKRFYVDHLGCTVRSEATGIAMLNAGQDWVALFDDRPLTTRLPRPAGPGVDHIAFRSVLRSFDERMTALRARSLNPVSPPGTGRVYFKDPDGIVLQLS